MKKGIHPENYRLVVFKDMSNGTTTITKSTAATKETIEIDGVEYPLVKMEISNTSHPFYTGKVKLVDTAVTRTTWKKEKNNRFSLNEIKKAKRRLFAFFISFPLFPKQNQHSEQNAPYSIVAQDLCYR